jgi:hypothetical protein
LTLKHTPGWNIEDQLDHVSDLDALTIRRSYERCELLRILANHLRIANHEIDGIRGVRELSIYDTPTMKLVFLTFNVGVLAAQL